MSSFLRSTALVWFLHPSQAVRFYCYWSPWFGYCLYCSCFSVRKLTASLLWSLLHSLAQFLPLHILITHWQRKLFDYFFSTTCLISIPGDTPNFKWWEWLNGGKIKTKKCPRTSKKNPKKSLEDGIFRVFSRKRLRYNTNIKNIRNRMFVFFISLSKQRDS